MVPTRERDGRTARNHRAGRGDGVRARCGAGAGRDVAFKSRFRRLEYGHKLVARINSTGTATFGFSNTTAISFSQSPLPVDAINFTNLSSQYSFALTISDGININLIVNGGGILGNSSLATFNVTGGGLVFDNSATAGNASINNIFIGTAGSITGFAGSSTAGSATIVNSGAFAETRFLINSSAGVSNILNEHGGTTSFSQTSSAGTLPSE